MSTINNSFTVHLQTVSTAHRFGLSPALVSGVCSVYGHTLAEKFHNEIANEQVLRLGDKLPIGTRPVIAQTVVARGPYGFDHDHPAAFFGHQPDLNETRFVTSNLQSLVPNFQEFRDRFVSDDFADYHSDVGLLSDRLVNRCWTLALHSAPPCRSIAEPATAPRVPSVNRTSVSTPLKLGKVPSISAICLPSLPARRKQPPTG